MIEVQSYEDEQRSFGEFRRKVRSAEVLSAAMERLQFDLSHGRWHAQYAELVALCEIDLGYRLVVADQ